MKLQQKDLIIIIVAVFCGLLLAYVSNKYLFSNAGSKNTQVDVVPVIKTDFPRPSSTYFNAQAVDPTQIINIGPNNSTQPFNGSH